MLQTIRRYAAALGASLVMFAVPLVASPAMVFAATNGTGNNLNIGTNLNCGSNINLTDNNGCDVSSGSKNVSSLITTIINVFSLIIGAISIIMIVWGGFQFGFSGGDPGKVKTARETIIYAIVGLVVVGVAQFLVQFVLGKVSGIGS